MVLVVDDMKGSQFLARDSNDRIFFGFYFIYIYVYERRFAIFIIIPLILLCHALIMPSFCYFYLVKILLILEQEKVENRRKMRIYILHISFSSIFSMSVEKLKLYRKLYIYHHCLLSAFRIKSLCFISEFLIINFNFPLTCNFPLTLPLFSSSSSFTMLYVW